ncbi:MAG: hypothetical protein C0432_01370 [Candidatus Puniceispirillum sp.]|nr:hypothetical protein [Candidatus Pelagibacter sp.]MBA4282931.1 hypothetical protein [Candidatus Puniceispirillum sp.]
MSNTINSDKILIQKPQAILMSLQNVQEEELNIITQNLANAQTPGFKAFVVMAEEAEYKSREKNNISFLKSDGTQNHLSNGSTAQTNNKLDFAISGNGVFAVQTDKGIRYTRNGRFVIDSERRLTDGTGNPILDNNLTEIIISGNVDQFYVANDGTMNLNNKNIGKLGVFTFENHRDFKLEGNNLRNYSQQSLPDDTSMLFQGGYEESNVSPVQASIQLMQVSHRYEEAQKMIQAYEDLQKETRNVTARMA